MPKPRLLVPAVVAAGLALSSACSSVGAPAQTPEAAEPRAAAAGQPCEVPASTPNPEAERLPLLELVPASGHGRLYTLSQEEAESAVTRHRMTLQPANLGLIPRTEAPESRPLFRLKRAPHGPRLVTPSTEECEALMARDGDWIYEGIVGYVYQEPGPGRVLLVRVSNTSEWRLVPESRRAEMEAAGYRFDGRVGYVDATG